MKAYCGAYVGPVMLFTEMPECATEFDVEIPDWLGPEDKFFWTKCPSCGAEVEVEVSV